jgi:hypothetical protein
MLIKRICSCYLNLRDKVAGGWIRLHYEERNLCSNKYYYGDQSEEDEVGECGGGEIKNTTKFYSGNLKGRDQLEDLGGDGNIILKRMLQKYGVKIWIPFM